MITSTVSFTEFKSYNHSCAADSCADVLINTPQGKPSFHLNFAVLS